MNYFFIKICVILTIVLLIWLYRTNFLSKKALTIIFTIPVIVISLIALVILGIGVYNLIIGYLDLGILTGLISFLLFGLSLLLIKHIIILLKTKNKLENKVSLVGNLFVVIFSWGLLLFSLIPSKHFYESMSSVRQFGMIVFLIIFGLLFLFHAFNDYKIFRKRP